MGDGLFDDPPFTVPPDPAALLAALGRMLSDDDLRIIAEADHRGDAEGHLETLVAIARHGAVPRPLDWCPREVLELTRWDEPPADPAQAARLWRHAFACCALLRAYGDDETCGLMLDQNPTLAGLALTLHHLSALPLPEAERDAPAAMNRQAAALLAWLLPRVADFAEADFFGLALLWFALAADVPAPALVALIDWVMAAEARSSGWHARLYRLGGGPRDWLFRRNTSELREHTWRALGALFPGRLRPEHGPAVAAGVRRIAHLLAPAQPSIADRG